MKRSGFVVFLKTSFETCKKRVGPEARKVRPLWKDPAAAKTLFEKRAKLYKKAADLIIDTDKLSPQQAAEMIAKKIFSHIECEFTATLGGESSQVVCTADAPSVIAKALAGKRVVLLTDNHVAKFHLARYQAALPKCETIILSPGERIKTLDSAKKLYEKLLQLKMNRDDVLLAIGGGTVTDFGAYVAATFKRGIKFVLVSTTLLGCVDAAVGGKAAVNLGNAKNIIGCFTVPQLVVLDAAALSTLPDQRVREGLVEAYKTGLIYNAPLAVAIEKNLDAMLSGDATLLGWVAAESARTKAAVVAQDFRESGLRAILNFGHTFGHAVEGFHKYKVSHGYCVAAGMAVAVDLSQQRGLISAELCELVKSTLNIIVPRMPRCPSLADAMEIMKHDKKIRDGKLVFVLLESVGKTRIVNDIKSGELSLAIKKQEA
jgi:3-dehydroquinate synthase